MERRTKEITNGICLQKMRKPAINEMNKIPKVYTLNELKGLLKLTGKEILEWTKFYQKLQTRINKLEKRKLDVGVFKG
jgi:hypothetical protein